MYTNVYVPSPSLVVHVHVIILGEFYDLFLYTHTQTRTHGQSNQVISNCCNRSGCYDFQINTHCIIHMMADVLQTSKFINYVCKRVRTCVSLCERVWVCTMVNLFEFNLLALAFNCNMPGTM